MAYRPTQHRALEKRGSTTAGQTTLASLLGTIKLEVVQGEILPMIIGQLHGHHVHSCVEVTGLHLILHQDPQVGGMPNVMQRTFLTIPGELDLTGIRYVPG